MVISGHQPGYLPWLGYFHKISLCDKFVYMDTVQYLENDWNNRNKIKTAQGWMWLTVPIDRRNTDGKMLDNIIVDSKDRDSKNFWQIKHWQAIENNYKKSKYFDLYASKIYGIYFNNVWEKLIDLCWEQLNLFIDLLEMKKPEIVRMSEQKFEGVKDKLILDHCKKLGGNKVVFGTQGRNYVDLSIFKSENIKVYFQDYNHPLYDQRFNGFESHMCILDLLFNCGKESLNIIKSGNVSIKEIEDKNLWE